MGQHKHNPTAIAAKKGEIPPKPRATMSKRESDRRILAHMADRMGLTAMRAMIREEYR